MRPPPTFAIPPSFLGVGPAGGGVTVAGIPLDIGTTNRSGSRFGPAAIRQASRMLVDGHHPTHWVLPAARGLADIGDFEIAMGELDASLGMIERQAREHRHLVALGGDHTVTLPLLRALAARHGQRLGLIHFDAHVDTWPDSFGLRYGHGSVFYHAIREGLVEPRRMVQIGIRSPAEKAVYDWTLAQGVRIVRAEQVVRLGIAEVSGRARAVLGQGPTYVSFDVDSLDPAFAPGTGTPEVGGLSTREAMELVRGCAGLDIVGGDVVEVAPQYDATTNTAQAAAQMLFEILSLVVLARKRPA
jgi:agmatinase